LPVRKDLVRGGEGEKSTVKVLAGIWNPRAQATEVSIRFGAHHPDAVVTSLAGAIIQLEQLAQAQASRGRSALPVASSADLSRLNLLELKSEEIVDAIIRETARVLRLPVSFVSLFATDEGFWKPRGVAGQGQEAPALSVACRAMAVANKTVVLSNVDQNNHEDIPGLADRGIRFYLSVPLRTKAGHLVGTLCATDTKPREVSDHEIVLLESLAAKLMEVMEKREQLREATVHASS
jgi:hypothetical protein